MLPKESYDSAEQCMRDFAEAERRLGVGFAAAEDLPSRENLGRTIIEDTPGVPTRSIRRASRVPATLPAATAPSRTAPPRESPA